MSITMREKAKAAFTRWAKQRNMTLNEACAYALFAIERERTRPAGEAAVPSLDDCSEAMRNRFRARAVAVLAGGGGDEDKSAWEAVLEANKPHLCEGGLPSASYGNAIDECREDDQGRFWVGNGEYSSQVNYCPFCGHKARTDAAVESG